MTQLTEEQAIRRRKSAEWIKKNKDYQDSDDPKKVEAFNKVKKVYQILSQSDPESPYRKDFSFSNMGKNFLPSLIKEVKNIATAVTDPKATGKALGNVLLGTVQKLIPGEQDSEKYADALGDYYAKKYGSTKAFLEYLETEPAAVLGDISMVLTGGGMVAAKVIGGVNKIAKSQALTKAQTVADSTAKAGAVIDPINLGINTAGYGFGQALNIGAPHLASRLYQSGLKPSTALSIEDTANIVKTGLDKDIPLNAEGIGKLQIEIQRASKVVDDLIDEASATGKTIPLKTILKSLDELEASFKSSPKEGGAAALQRIKLIRRQMTADFKVTGKKSLTAKELNDYKRSIYGEQSFNKRNQSGTNITEQSLSAKGRGAKGLLEELDPRLQGANRELGNLLQLQPELMNQVNRLQKKDMVSIGAPIKLDAVTGVIDGGSNIAKKAAQIGSVLIDYTPFKSSISRIMHKKQTTNIFDQFNNNSPVQSFGRNLLSETGDPAGGISNLEDFIIQKQGGLLQ